MQTTIINPNFWTTYIEQQQFLVTNSEIYQRSFKDTNLETTFFF